MTDLKKTIWIDAPPDVVFAYFTDAEKTARWCGVGAEVDPVPGGVYRLDMGVAGVFDGTIIEIEPGKSLSWEVRGPEGVAAPPSVIEISVTAEAGGTRVHIRQTGLTPPFDRMAGRGWDHHLARLSVSATGGQPPADPLCKRPIESLME
ncbi:MAG: SRPBCC domain-containing protein [Sphingomonadales bacterium]|nr:SRPBCC domain-containing protein [Sphingomonadales bacterium]